MKKWIQLFIIVFILFSQSACWDMHEVQSIHYVISIGVDYDEQKKQYVIYAHSMNFDNAAKKEQGAPSQPTIVWVGKGIGSTVNLAMNDLYNTGQQRMVWAHISTILLSDKAIKQGIYKIEDALHRYREIRFTPWVYATKEPLDKILSTQPFFYNSFLYTVLHEPEEVYEQKSWIEPIQYMTFISNFAQPGRTTHIPEIAISQNTWKKDLKKEPKLIVTGAYFLANKKWKGYMNNQQLQGWRWMTAHTFRSPLAIKKDGKILGVFSLEDPRIRVETKFVNHKPRYTLIVQLNGNIVELLHDTNEKTLVKLANENVKKEIKETYTKSILAHVDVYQLEYDTYKKHYNNWKKMKQRGFKLDLESLQDIKVSTQINHTGTYK